MQRLLELATGDKTFKAVGVSYFDFAHVITSDRYSLHVDEKGEIIEMVMYLRIQNTNKVIFGISLYEMPLSPIEKYQNPIRIQNQNYFERTIHNLPHVLNILKELGYRYDDIERYHAPTT